MTKDIRPAIPSSVCLSCDGCCRFAERYSPWSPLFLFEEIRLLVEKDLVPSVLFSGVCGSPGQPARIDLEPAGEGWVCPCLDLTRNACRIYEYRPLECRLYPFLLVLHQGRRALALDDHCPHFPKQAEADIQGYAQELKMFLSTPDMKVLLQKNPQLFQAYPQGYKVLWYF